jgi:Hypothetical glycosyl hydrolase family 15
MRLEMLSVVLVAGFVLTGTAAPAASPPPPAANTTMALTLNCLSAPYGCEKDFLDVQSFSMVIVQPWHDDLIPQAEAAGTFLLPYKCMASARDPNRWGDTAGVSLAEANRHPEWFLLNEHGQRIEWDPWPGVWQLDVGNRGYQEAWLRNVLAFLRAHDWKAVTIDNANVDPQAVYFPSETMVKYPTQAAYTAATRSFLAFVGPRLQAAGYELYPNIQDHHDLDVWRAAWRDWLPFISGGMRQHFLRWSNPGAELWGGQTWLEIVSLFEEVQRAGKSFHTATPLDDPKGDLRSLRYGRASWFVAWNGRSRSTYGGPVGEHVGELQEWRQEIGRPVEARRLYAAGVWGKRYDAGIALVNTGDMPQVVDLGGEYRHPDGHTTSVVSLAGRHGLVLARGLPAEGRDLKARLNRLLTTIGALLFPGAADGLARDEVHEERWQDPAVLRTG